MSKAERKRNHLRAVLQPAVSSLKPPSMTNPYESPQAVDQERPEQPSRRPAYAYIVATVGALVVFGGVFIVVMLLMSFFGQTLAPRNSILDAVVWIFMILFGFALAVTAAGYSFRATLRQYPDS